MRRPPIALLAIVIASYVFGPFQYGLSGAQEPSKPREIDPRMSRMQATTYQGKGRKLPLEVSASSSVLLSDRSEPQALTARIQ